MIYIAPKSQKRIGVHNVGCSRCVVTVIRRMNKNYNNMLNENLKTMLSNQDFSGRGSLCRVNFPQDDIH